jgi:hypothetical protein
MLWNFTTAVSWLDPMAGFNDPENKCGKITSSIKTNKQIALYMKVP